MNSLVVSARTAAFDDWEFDEVQNPASPGGRTVVEWLADSLGSHSDVIPHKFYGWCFELIERKPNVWCMVAMGVNESEYYFWAETRPTLIQMLAGNRVRPDQPTLDRIVGLLANDDRFEDVNIVAPGG